MSWMVEGNDDCDCIKCCKVTEINETRQEMFKEG